MRLQVCCNMMLHRGAAAGGMEGNRHMAARRSGLRPPPPSLSPEEWASLRSWADAAVPWVSRGALGASRTLEGYVDEVLDWARSNGRRKADWVATCRNWIRRDERARLERLVASRSPLAERAREALRSPAAWAASFDGAAPPPVSGGGVVEVRGGRVADLFAPR